MTEHHHVVAARAHDTRRGVGLAACAAIAFATNPVFVLLAAPLAAFDVAAWRLLVGSALVGIVSVVRYGVSRPNPRTAICFVAYGGIIAVHFAASVSALQHTSLAHALTLIYTAPSMIALLSWWWLDERLSRWQAAGLGIVMVGIGLLTGLHGQFDSRTFLGDGFALLSALCYALYSMAGRFELRRRTAIQYASGVYVCAALWLLPVVQWATVPSYTRLQWTAVIALGVVPLGAGHTLYNASLRWIPATYANVLASQEVTGGILLGWLILQREPTLLELVGTTVTLVGTALVLLARTEDC